MISFDEALQLVSDQARPLMPRRVSLGETAGLVLAEDVVSEINSPPYDKAMMDGYAVVSGDQQPERRVIEEIAAGSAPHLPVTPGTVARIMTGAPLPEGADAIVPVEQTELLEESLVRLHQVDPPPGKHIMPLGTSIQAGRTVLQQGTLLRPIEMAILAEIGHALVLAQPGPKVAVLPTGDELVPVGKKPSVSQIRNSNGPLLIASAEQAGALAVELKIGPDQQEDLGPLIEQGLEADVLLVTGGVSAGKYDLVPQVFAELGVEQVFHKVAIKPGKPLWFGTKSIGDRKVLVFGLPGNPVSSFICFELFVRPALAALAGRGFVGLRQVTARLKQEYKHRGGRVSYLPAHISGIFGPGSEKTVELTPWQGSADLAGLAAANSLVRLSDQPASFTPGTPVEVLLLEP